MVMAMVIEDKEDKQVDIDGNVTVGDGGGDDVETYFLF